MKIIKTKLADFIEDNSTVSVTARASGYEETFHVQTVEGRYKAELGCYILTDASDGKVEEDEYEGFDFECIIYEAEKYISTI